MKKHKYTPNLIFKVDSKINRLLVYTHERNYGQELVDDIRRVLNKRLTLLHDGDKWVKWLIKQD